MSSFPEEKIDPRVKRTRALLEQAFLQVTGEKGFQAASVQDIAERAGVNRATFYAHFADKYALLAHSMRQLFRAEIEKRMLDTCHYTAENLKALIVAVCEFIADASSHCTPVDPQFEPLMAAQVKDELQSLLQVWLEKEHIDSDPKMAATAACWALYGLALQWTREKAKNRPSAEEYAVQVLPLVAGSLKLTQVV